MVEAKPAPDHKGSLRPSNGRGCGKGLETRQLREASNDFEEPTGPHEALPILRLSA